MKGKDAFKFKYTAKSFCHYLTMNFLVKIDKMSKSTYQPTELL